jgi:hypothetical protein
MQEVPASFQLQTQSSYLNIFQIRPIGEKKKGDQRVKYKKKM